MTITLTSLLVTYLVFGLLGFVVARKFKGKPGPLIWIVLVGMTVLSQWILTGTRVIAVFEFQMYANRVLQALFAGVLLGLALKSSKS